MLFCFDFLPYITSEEFSILPKKSSRLKENHSEANISNCSAFSDLGEKRNPHARDSNGSINSFGSTNEPSNTGMFFINSFEEECSVHSAYSHPSSRSRNSSGSDFLHVQASNSQQRSSCPVEVPSSSRGRQSDIEESPTCGSWQVITGTGSFINSYTPPPGASRGSQDSTSDLSRSSKDSTNNTHPRGSQDSTSDTHSRGSRDSSSEIHSKRGSQDSSSSSQPNRLSSCEEATENICNSQRWQRLDAIRRIFNNAYHNKITRKFKPDKGITNLLDQFAEKVGIRQPKMFT